MPIKKCISFILNIQNYGPNIVFEQSKNYLADRDGPKFIVRDCTIICSQLARITLRVIESLGHKINPSLSIIA
jgi:hypothetical protein